LTSSRMVIASRPMNQQDPKDLFVFPEWTNWIRPLAAIGGIGGAVYAVVFIWFGLSPKTLNVGYQPEQPVPYSHELHAGQLGIDCRYCHTTVDKAAYAAIPPTETCMNCHASIRADSEKLELVRESAKTGEPIPWVKVHDLPDYVFFDHSAHVTRGVGCVECHGRVDTMEVVRQTEPLSMSWCLDCHRDPATRIRPPDQVVNMDWSPDGDREAFGQRLMEERNLHPSQDCWTCHR